ncbi:uncharacterized protein LOC131891309 [Tigriopus californicus]|uniref:uncharacterized protein LOC131891309 n=1 Tax=Tigriopus californicus TaxID=6832 RepID=UPI0027D9D7DA|nr:uncharacterized protein LOC131891309 [Tigriopus californicus]
MLRGRMEQPRMADLPLDRLQPVPPFTFVGVDFFGPLAIRNKRKDEKRYGAVFSCLSSRAVHIEVAQSMDTSSFIGCLRRMIARRGPVKLLRSDNGLNFVGAEREMLDALNEMDKEKVRVYLNDRGSDFQGWKRNPPVASNFGGVWERQIRTIRAILSSLLIDHGHCLNDETFRTLICEVEAIMNSRPLTVDNLSDPESPLPLTPAMMLTQKTQVFFPPPGEFEKNDVYSRRHWRRTQYLANQFWSRFRREYLESLQPRQKWNQYRPNISQGDIVLLKEENLPRNKWKLGLVTEAFPDDKGVVRSVRVRVGDRTSNHVGPFHTPMYHRPANKMVLLHRASEDQKKIPDEGAQEINPDQED